MSKLDNVRISLKIDDLSNWNNSNIILNNGEIALIRLPNDQVKIKVGDGNSYISALNYLNEQEFFTSKISAYNAEFGFKNYAQRFSIAEGQNVSAYGTYQHAAGYNVEAISNETFAFVWNGKNLYGYNNRYKSHGAGTFSLNPENGLSGFYIGEKHLADILYNNISNEIEPLKNSVNQNIATLNTNIGNITQATNNLNNNIILINKNITDLQATDIGLSSKIDNKILIDDNPANQLEVRHVSRDIYHELVISEEGPLSNTIYIISSDNLNAYDQKIENVADGEKDTDAVNLGQLKSYSDVLSVNYETLCNLKETGKLITGKTYCLTDYYVGKETDVNYKECYLNGDKEHRFDILITVMSPNTLSEHCKAITYDNKEYEIWYSLKDETERFDYPDIFERGIIYRMIDENNNDLPYDFKSILINSEYSIDGNDCSNIKVEQNIIDEKISMNFCKFEGKCFNIKVGQHCYSSRFANSSNIIFGNYCQENDLQNTNDITFGNYCSENILYNVKQIKFESNCILNTIVNSNNICFNFNCRNNWIGDQVGGIPEEEIKPTYNISIDSDSNNIYIGDESYNINIGKQCSFILFGCSSEQLYRGTHNVNVNNDVSLVKFFDLPEDKQLQNIEIKSGIHSKDIYVTYENMLYREVLSTIAPKGAYNLTI